MSVEIIREGATDMIEREREYTHHRLRARDKWSAKYMKLKTHTHSSPLLSNRSRCLRRRRSSALDSLNLFRNDHRIVLAQLFALHRFVVETARVRRRVSMLAAEHAAAATREAGETDTFLARMASIGLFSDINTDRLCTTNTRIGLHRGRLLYQQRHTDAAQRRQR